MELHPPDPPLGDELVELRPWQGRDVPAIVAACTLWVHGRIGELGYWAAPEFRGRGYVTRAVRLLSRWAFDDVELPRLQLGTFPGNTASERVAQKCGFTREGLLRAWLEQRGVRRDVTMWSLLPGDPT